MPIQENIRIGGRYELQPKSFHRPIRGVVTKVNGSEITVKVQSSELCDRDKIPKDQIILADAFDVKHALENSYFFS